ncbi:2-succinyl-5-enolpyruvyl-6-hydroxy-3-cyclohexene-1-carboxylic-acid synthase [Hugenholtzia roseola]|uniref:2-succinyl-5-enolpyruvyl-6-hydroxy-3- cyclohexene-1-carboxylic-acid synthase n=1 Tax=Hugenholtzia roseola TaxID=1002 RepID=UPI00042233AE|nr:2-succinyl-5-enolpyruvyl-6-hydroxy-3-cyclohexene-1-carboxylic-acid synthase [Hugenholtzia roseola]
MAYAFQPTFDIPEICYQHGITKAVLCPGSRSAPLTLAFARHKHIETFLFSDERSAAFIALGMAQSLGETVVLVCTSGTAAYNFAPAVAEAFFQKIPLLILTADRPPEWIAQQDGQTIFQQNLYGKHVKAFFQLPTEQTHPDAMWQIERQVSEALNLAASYPPAPVHLNVPLREPFYPKSQTKPAKQVRIIEEWSGERVLPEALWNELYALWNDASRKLIVAGQGAKDAALLEVLNQIEVPLVNDIIGNCHQVKKAIRYHDAFLMAEQEWAELKPDLLITFGGSVLSKNLKRFLRKMRPAAHWHIQAEGEVADVFQSLTRIIRLTPLAFFEKVLAKQRKFAETYRNSFFLDNWYALNAEIADLNTRYLDPAHQPLFSEFSAVKTLLAALPNTTVLHLGNSMPVRYANFINLDPTQEVEVFANRGTSGIDGCNSTALGHALAAPDRLHVLLIGDVSFFYDRNAFWHEHLPKNLRLLVLNNHGSGIFKLVEAGAQPECDNFFVGKQPLNAKKAAKEYGFEYERVKTEAELAEALPDFFKKSKVPKILEVEVALEDSLQVFQDYKKAVLTINR